jgi:Arc/MetJ family transcription regulator
MSRTNIDIDDELVAIVMNRFNLPTKKSAVDMALRRLVVETDQMKLIDSIFGIGWDGPPDGRFTDALHTS